MRRAGVVAPYGTGGYFYIHQPYYIYARFNCLAWGKPPAHMGAAELYGIVLVMGAVEAHGRGG